MHLATSQPPLSVLLVDDHVAVRKGLEILLHTQGIDVIGDAGCSVEGLRLFDDRRPDVTVIDFHLGTECGADLADEILAVDPGANVLVYTGAADDRTYERVLSCGARGIAYKGGDIRALSEAIRTIAAGGAFFACAA